MRLLVVLLLQLRLLGHERLEQVQHEARVLVPEGRREVLVVVTHPRPPLHVLLQLRRREEQGGGGGRRGGSSPSSSSSSFCFCGGG
jgi:hypothetical protein